MKEGRITKKLKIGNYIIKIKRRCNKTGLFILLFFITSFSLFVYAYDEKEIGHHFLDSLHTELSNYHTPQERITILRKIVKFYWQRPEEVDYWKEIIDLSAQTDSFSIMYEAMGSLCRYYYNVDKIDSVYYWSGQIDSISRIRKECPNSLFMTGYIVCLRHLREKNYELAMDETVRLLTRAKEKNIGYGLMMVNHNMALIYQAIGRDSDAVVFFRKGLAWLNENMENTLFKQQYLSEMIESTLRLDEVDESEELLKQYRDLVGKTEQKFEENNLPFPSVWQCWYLNAYSAELYMRKNQLDKAKKYLDKATNFANASTDKDMKFPYYHAHALYYYKVRNIPLAVQMIDSAYSITGKLGLLGFKIEALRKGGYLNEALMVYDDLLAKTDSTRNEALDRQIKQIFYLNNMNDLEKQSRDLEYQNEQIVAKQRLLFVFTCLSVILLVLLYVLYYLYKRAHRLKSDLVIEKQSLVKTEKFLFDAKEKAELANRQKSAFIASISHEIRTPLNAIVGFSELLTDDEYDEEEKIKFATLINDNAELLMNLVNDVLDLSRLESGNYKVSVKPCDIIACCRECIEGISHKVASDIKLIFSPPVDSYILKTDLLRLKQLLNNLLSNAAKFTEQGEIILSLEIDEINRQVRFSVTDTGCGIPKEKYDEIFEHFEKLDEFRQGTGLGLPICRNIAVRLGGFIFIDPSYKTGARFIFIHPFEIS